MPIMPIMQVTQIMQVMQIIQIIQSRNILYICPYEAVPEQCHLRGAVADFLSASSDEKFCSLNRTDVYMRYVQ